MHRDTALQMFVLDEVELVRFVFKINILLLNKDELNCEDFFLEYNKIFIF